MKSSMMIVGAFVVGCVVSYFDLLPAWFDSGEVVMWVLYALMIQVGMSIG
ncbi:MAG: LysO family transporter, partial [Alistipes sp.]|nr:LysO family transporter [Alistipes sp.]